MASKAKKQGARPDGTVQWTVFMTDLCGEFTNKPCDDCGGTLREEAGFAENLAFFEKHRFWSEDVPARMQMLRWFPTEAVDLVMAPFKASLARGRVSERLLKVVVNINDDRVIDTLIAHLHLFPVKTALARMARRWPLHILGLLLDLNPGRNQPAAGFILELLAANPQWTEDLKTACNAGQKKTLDRLLATEEVSEAAADDLPAILTSPPWCKPRKLALIPELDLPLRYEPAVVHWPAETPHSPLSAEAVAKDFEFRCNSYFVSNPPAALATWSVEQKALFILGCKVERIDEVIASRVAAADDFSQPAQTWCDLSSALLTLPDDLAEQVLQHAQAQYFLRADIFGETWSQPHQILRRFGESAVQAVVRTISQEKSRRLLPLVEMIESDALAMPLAWLFCRNRWAKQQALGCLLRFPEAAIRGLLPVAFGPDDPLRPIARLTLIALIGQGMGEVARAQAALYGPAAAEVLAILESISAEDLLPEKMPALPKNLPLQALPRLMLKAGGAIPLELLPEYLTILMLSKADAPYAGLAVLQEHVTADSLARLGQALFKWWQDNDTAPKDRWMFEIQGLVGNDETARQLNLALRQWRAGLNRVRAYDALSMLVQIGSDVALMYLYLLHQQTRFNDIHERAGAMMISLAEERNLSAEQLADRTVPDLGLDAQGGLLLDFGPRQFVVNFDESLLPYVKDADGKRLKDLPKPGAKDDEALAGAAFAQYKDLKKQAKSVASVQVKRLEAAMTARRRWASDEFLEFFVQHPLLRHLAQRLIWGVYDSQDTLLAACRIGEDLSLANVEDENYDLPATARIGIAHVLELPAELAAGFGHLLADYRIIQPFPQLTRETYVLRPEDASRNELPEWQGRKVTTGSLLGLEQRGWNRVVGDGGMVDSFVKQLGPDSTVYLAVEEGWFVAGEHDVKEVQEISRVAMSDAESNWQSLDAVTFSEMQRDLHLMAWFDTP